MQRSVIIYDPTPKMTKAKFSIYLDETIGVLF